MGRQAKQCPRDHGQIRARTVKVKIVPTYGDLRSDACVSFNRNIVWVHLTLSDSRSDRSPSGSVGVAISADSGSPPITQITVSVRATRIDRVKRSC
jgi:hypothetical protein